MAATRGDRTYADRRPGADRDLSRRRHATNRSRTRPGSHFGRWPLYLLLIGLIAAAGLVSPLTASDIALADASFPAGDLDAPADGATAVGSVAVSGWALDAGASTGTGVDRVQVYLDGALRGTATYGLSRPDIAASYGARFAPTGYRYTLDLAGVPVGSHTIEVRARSTVTGVEARTGHVVNIPFATAPHGALEAPAGGATASGSITVSGWAIDEAAPTGTGVDRIRIFLDGTYRTDATYGQSRPDIAGAYGSRFGPSGYTTSLSLAGLTAGSHTVEARARSTVTGAEAVSSGTINVTVPPTGTPVPIATPTTMTGRTGYPVGSIDDPAEGATVAGSVALTGWAIDVGATDGTTGVDRVQIYLDGTLLGDASYNRPRPDIASGYGAQFVNSGFRYLVDASGLAPGSHRLEARARSTVSGTETSYIRNVTIAAPTATPVIPATPTPTATPVGYPAGGLDAPADGLTVTGSVTLSGWAIDQAATTGTGVDRVGVFLDGTYRADAQYGLARPDIAGGYGSRFGPSGYQYTLDLSSVAPGSHILQARAHSIITGQDAVSSRTIVVASSGAPAGGIEQPAQSAQVVAGASIAVSGYALDQAAPTGTGVDLVRVLVDDVYRGDAQYGLSRPDVAARYGARFAPTGYGYTLDLTGLTAGTHYVEARAHSSVNGVEARYIHAIVVSAAPTPTPTGQVTLDARFGVNAHLLYDSLDRASSDLDRVQAAHLGLVRVDVQWDRLELSQGTFDDGYLIKLDGVMDRAAARGIRPLLVVLGTPAWARGGTGSALTPPTNPAD